MDEKTQSSTVTPNIGTNISVNIKGISSSSYQNEKKSKFLLFLTILIIIMGIIILLIFKNIFIFIYNYISISNYFTFIINKILSIKSNFRL